MSVFKDNTATDFQTQLFTELKYDAERYELALGEVMFPVSFQPTFTVDHKRAGIEFSDRGHHYVYYIPSGKYRSVPDMLEQIRLRYEKEITIKQYTGGVFSLNFEYLKSRFPQADEPLIRVKKNQRCGSPSD